ncbi:MAG: hypothetical protein ACREX4_24430 [Gammaproteobacteria bacterium]
MHWKRINRSALPVDAQAIVRMTTQEAPPRGTHWSSRTLAARIGVSDTTVLRIWQQHGLKPHLVETFKVSRDPRFRKNTEEQGNR